MIKSTWNKILVNKVHSSCVKIAICVAIAFILPKHLVAQEYLSTPEFAQISGAALGATYVSHHVRRMDTTRSPLLNGPLLFDKSIQKMLGGEFKPGPCNFLDNRFGSAITPLSAGALLVITNLSYPQGDKNKETFQDLFLFTSGLFITKGITGLAKGIVTRPRPYTHLSSSNQHNAYGFLTDRSSFFSGHTSAAFFSAAYLNLRIRSTMRSEMTDIKYNNWKWTSPTILFGWASFVGLSRVHAYKHYFSDVLAGAVVGYLVAELMYSLNKNDFNNNSPISGNQFLFKINLKF